MNESKFRKFLAAGSLMLSVSGLLIATPASAGTYSLVSTSRSPMAMTNDEVTALAYANQVVYAGGYFTRMYFKGRRYVRSHIGAVSSLTGATTTFRPAINGAVRSLALSPDKKVLYVGGSFTRVNGVTRMNIAAFRTSTGRLTSFAPKVAGTVVAIAATSYRVYLGGTISQVNGRRRTDVAEVTTAGRLTAWAPVLDGWVRALLISPDKTRIFLGGGFHHVNGTTYEGLGSVSTATGTNEPFRNGLIPTYHDGRVSQATSLATNGRWIFAGAEGTGTGAFDGTLAFRPDSGRLVWRNTCLGATQTVLYLHGVLYKGSHAHDCSSSGGFGPIKPGWQPHHLLAENPVNGRLLPWGTSARSILQPIPDTNGGVRVELGPFAFATDGRQLFVGGDFTTVNAQPQEGLARFE
jgi:hypothetical protein